MKKILNFIKNIPKLIKAKYYTKKANKLLQKNKLEEAKKYYLKLEDMGFVNYMIYHNIGSIFFQQANFDKAEGYFKKSIELKPENVVTYSTLSEIYLRKKEWKKAEEIIEKALKKEPFNYFLKKRKKKVFNKNWRKSYIQSIEDTEKALKAKQEDNIEEAKNHFESAIKKNNKNTTALFIYGNMLYKEGKYHKALKYISMSVEFSNNKHYAAVLNRLQKEMSQKNIKQPR